jgi:hypothetical protein
MNCAQRAPRSLRRIRPGAEARGAPRPQSFHEPYYTSYIEEDFGAIGRACGLTHIRDINTFVSKVMVFDKPL